MEDTLDQQTKNNNVPRQFIWKGGLLLFSTILAACNSESKAVINYVDAQGNVQIISDEIKNQFGITPHLIEPPPNEIRKVTEGSNTLELDYTLPAPDTVRDQYKELYQALTIYPPEIFNNLQTKHISIMIVRDLSLTVNGEVVKTQGTHTESPDGAVTMYIGPRDKTPKEIFDHELFHQLCEGGNAQLIQTAFSSINYNQGLPPYPESQDATHSETMCELTTGNEPKGSASCYGQSSLREDAAEIARRLMAGDKDFWERLKNDEALRLKSEAVIQVYLKVSNGKMNVQYFEELRNKIIPNWGWKPLDTLD